MVLGRIFRDAIVEVLETLTSLGKYGLALVVVALVAYVLSKWWRRRQFVHQLRMDRVTVDELRKMIDEERVGTILDVRSALTQDASGRIPGARRIDMKKIEAGIEGVAREGEVIVYCACPNEASAVRVAQEAAAAGLQARAAASRRHRRVDRRGSRRRALSVPPRVVE